MNKNSTIEYRVYYDETGKVTCMTNENLPGNYIRISKEIYDRASYKSMRVINGKLTRVNHTTDDFALVRSSKGYTSVKGHASILTNSTRLETQTYGFKHH